MLSFNVLLLRLTGVIVKVSLPNMSCKCSWTRECPYLKGEAAVTSDNFMYYYYLEYFMFIINQGQIHKLPDIRYIFKVMFYLMLSVYMLQVRAHNLCLQLSVGSSHIE